MKIDRIGGFCLALLIGSAVFAQTNTSLTRAEVTAIKNKLVTVQTAMGADPAGYLKESEDFSLPTDSNPAQGGKYWPITSSVSLRYTDRAVKEAQDTAEQASQDFQQRYAAALASTDPNAIVKLTEEITRIQQQAAAAAMAQPKQPMDVYVQFNMNPTVGIDPDAVVFERSGVIALRETNVGSDQGRVTVYLDPVALAATETLSKIELRTAQDGVANKSGIYHIVISLNGTLTDIEAWAQSFDTAAMLTVFDSQ
jgi:DNA-directed RNA polymerase subunit F